MSEDDLDEEEDWLLGVRVEEAEYWVRRWQEVLLIAENLAGGAKAAENAKPRMRRISGRH